MQTQPGKYTGAIDCTRKACSTTFDHHNFKTPQLIMQVLDTHGPKGLFKGMATPLATVAVFNAVLFATRGQMENALAHADGTEI